MMFFPARAHARILSRPWAADAFLSKVVHEFVEKGKSIAKMITYSHSVKDMHVSNREQSNEMVSQSIRDFAFAPQRFNSEAKVLLRICLTLDATLATMSQIISLRGPASAEGQSCLETMEFIDAEVLLTLGMMADAAREVSRVVEACDKSDLDEAMLPTMMSEFDIKITRLFVQGQCIHVPGMTMVMMNNLMRPRTYLVRGVPKSIGHRDGVSHVIVTRCLKRMATWATLAKSVMCAEFSDWELLASFQIFSLARNGGDVKTSAADKLVHLKRLATAIGIDADDLATEFFHFEPIAIKMYRSKTTSNFNAWADVVRRTRKRKGTAMRHPSDNLVACLARYGAWSSSSCDVERGFAVSSELMGGYSEGVNTCREENVMILRCDAMDEDETKEVVRSAQKIWCSTYGRPRVRPHQNFNAGP
jgi:hypothetical protein